MAPPPSRRCRSTRQRPGSGFSGTASGATT
uniref:Uncharacterized protein n=1 Tax=Arundo donax TaxID=35708 RepID=A0A0A9A128_ARUDO